MRRLLAESSHAMDLMDDEAMEKMIQLLSQSMGLKSGTDAFGKGLPTSSPPLCSSPYISPIF